MIALSQDVLVEREIPALEHENLLQAIAQAQNLVENLGAIRSNVPLSIFCKTPACALYFGGYLHRSIALMPGQTLAGATYTATRPTVVILQGDIASKADIAHEFIHHEVLHRLHGTSLPTWFHEGVATFISDNVQCTDDQAAGIDDLQRLEHVRAWAEYTTQGVAQNVYCQAKREIALWVKAHSLHTLVALIDARSRGNSFEKLYGPLKTCGSEKRTQVVMSTSTELSDDKPFSLSFWVKPSSNTGVLVHLSESPIGTGWCAPVLGFDSSQRLVAQIPHNAQARFTKTLSSNTLDIGAWSHVALTWSPGKKQTVYVNGTATGESEAAAFFSPSEGNTVFVTWGSMGWGGTGACWNPDLKAVPFDGMMSEMKIFSHQLEPNEVRALSRTKP